MYRCHWALTEKHHGTSQGKFAPGRRRSIPPWKCRSPPASTGCRTPPQRAEPIPVKARHSHHSGYDFYPNRGSRADEKATKTTPNSGRKHERPAPRDQKAQAGKNNRDGTDAKQSPPPPGFRRVEHRVPASSEELCSWLCAPEAVVRRHRSLQLQRVSSSSSLSLSHRCSFPPVIRIYRSPGNSLPLAPL